MLALVHAVGDALAHCELTYVARQPIDVARARAQHAAYCDLLRSAGAEVRVVDVSPGFPDAVFLEDVAVVLPEVAVAASMGAPSRRGEVDNILPELASRRQQVVRVPPSAKLEGGDVLRVGQQLFVGLTTRTDEAGVAALTRAVQPFGYRVTPVRVRGCLHLKSACTALDDQTLLANRAFVDCAPFAPMRVIDVAPEEPHAANVLRVGKTVLASESHLATVARLARAGYHVRTVDICELEKAEAGMTCLSLWFGAMGE